MARTEGQIPEGLLTGMERQAALLGEEGLEQRLLLRPCIADDAAHQHILRGRIAPIVKQ